jgi:hypothetical protein
MKDAADSLFMRGAQRPSALSSRSAPPYFRTARCEQSQESLFGEVSRCAVRYATFQVLLPAPASFCRPASGRFPQGAFVVPSEDYSHAPPCSAAFFDEGRQNETNRRTQKKTMKPAAQNNIERLKSRTELLDTGKRIVPPRRKDTFQLSFRLPQTPVLRTAGQFRLRTGDFVLFNGRICPVLHVNDCAAVISVSRHRREFTTLFGKSVSLRPKPRLIRISPNSEIPILNRRRK